MKNKIELLMAPMAGVTDRAFREMVIENGADLAFTEMVNIKGLFYNDKATERIMDFGKKSSKTAVQIFGRDPDILERVVEEKINKLEDIDYLDFNLGCPAPKIFKNHEGSYLMKEPDLVKDLLERLVKSSRFPVSCKIRLGVDEKNKNYLEIGKIAQEAGVERITLHARTREAYYSGKADYTAIKALRESLEIPVIGNGDIFSVEDFKEMLEQTGVKKVMLARGALGRPFLFRQIKDYLEGKEIKEPSLDEILDMLNTHYQKVLAYKPEDIALREMRKHCAWYLKGLKNSNYYKDKINNTKSREEVYDLLKEYREKNQNN